MTLTVYKKMMFGFGAIITILIISSSYALFELNSVSNGAKRILSSNVRTQELARQLQAIIIDENGYAEKYLVSNDETYFVLFMETRKQVDLNLAVLLDQQSSKQGTHLIQGMQAAHKSFVDGIQKTENQSPGRTRQHHIDVLTDSLDFLITHNQSIIGKEMARIESITARSVQVAMLLIMGTLFVAVTAAFIITRTITRPIHDLIKGTEQIACGNFKKILVSSHDEIALLAEAINDMSSKIKDTNELKTQMMQLISHELKSPLQAMQSAHDVLKVSGFLEGRHVQMLDAIDRGIDTIANYSEQYLDLAKIESGVVQYNKKLSDLREIVRPIVEDAKLAAAAKKITLNLDSTSLPKAMLDREKVSVIVNNLISNAIKYTRQDGNINVTLCPGDLGVQVKVQDSGIGISRDEISNVFVRFYQASNIKKVKSTGSGVGLAIVKAYAEGHGGKVRVESSLDKGSIFTVEFPIIDCQPMGDSKTGISK